MKKITRRQRHRDIRHGILIRRGHHLRKHCGGVSSRQEERPISSINSWIDNYKKKHLNATIAKRKRITLHLPEEMNFCDNYEVTVLHILAIRKLSNSRKSGNKSYRLVSVNFDNLRTISTSAALVLTAELSKWDDAIRQQLKPMIDNWDAEILKQFIDLGFFELFRNSSLVYDKSEGSSPINLVKYIKGQCGDNSKPRVLKEKIIEIIGEKVCKWNFLHGGLTEAITNVSHHAYPNSHEFSKEDKNWYLTGSYNDATKELKIVFYDQGIGIPKSLPASDIWEKVLSVLSGISSVERKRDEVLLKAAVELERTSTKQSDRGKGLQDLLEFIRQRKDGYLSILSLKGLFKYSISNGKEEIKTEHFDQPVCGTLIIWSATLHE